MNRKLLIVGLDGVSWEELNLLINNAHLATLKKLVESGSHATLLSTTPPVTGPAWSSFATGKNPGKHGVFDFILPRGSLNDLKPVTSYDIKGRTFYEILESKGIKCVLVNMPVTYPTRIRGIVITSLMTVGDNFIFPETLLKEIPDLENYRIIPDTSLLGKGKLKEYIQDIRALENVRFKCAQKLFRKDWDFFFLLFSGTDWINHIMYKQLLEFAESDDIRETIAFYREIDEYIEWFLENIPPKTNILIVSDHGFRACDTVFFVNEWLRRKGYLNVVFKPVKKIPHHKFGRELEKTGKYFTIPSLLSKLLFLITQILPLDIFYEVYSKIRKYLPFTPTLEVTPNFNETTAYSTSSESRAIYLNVQSRFKGGNIKDSETYKTIRQNIIHELKRLKAPNGDPLFKAVLKREDVFEGSLLKNAPDIIMVPNRCMLASYFAPILFSEKVTLNDHDSKGIFIAYGPDVKKNIQVKDLRIIDVAPTILHIFGMPIPSDMDGRATIEILREESEITKRHIIYQETEKERITKILRRLKQK